MATKERPLLYTHCAGSAFIVLSLLLIFALPMIPLKSNAVVDVPFLPANMAGKALVFAGFPGCNAVCPISMGLLRQVYTGYQKQSQTSDLHVVFINIELNTPDDITRDYAKSFHTDFDGYSIRSNEAKAIYRDLSLSTANEGTDVSNHDGRIFLFTSNGADWRLKRVFFTNSDPSEMLDYLLNNPV